MPGSEIDPFWKLPSSETHHQHLFKDTSFYFTGEARNLYTVNFDLSLSHFPRRRGQMSDIISLVKTQVFFFTGEAREQNT